MSRAGDTARSTRTRPTLSRWQSGLRARLGAADEGRAIVEFVFLGLLLIVPLTYLVLTAARLQAAAFSASLAGREAGRAFVTADSDGAGFARARTAAGLAFADFSFERGADVTVTCSASPCLTPDAGVTATARIEVQLPLIPDFVSERLPTSVTITSTHLATVDRFVAR